MPSCAGGERAPLTFGWFLGTPDTSPLEFSPDRLVGLGQGKTKSREIPYSLCGR